MENSKIKESQLVEMALEAREASIVLILISRWEQLLTTTGKVYKGCNIENAAYTPSNSC